MICTKFKSSSLFLSNLKRRTSILCSSLHLNCDFRRRQVYNFCRNSSIKVQNNCVVSFIMDPCIPFPLDPQVLIDVVDKAKDWAIMHGVGMRGRDNYSKDSINFAPFLLLPSTFPRCEFDKSIRIQTVLNELIHKVAHDYELLRDVLANTIKVDDFTGRLFKIYETVRAEGIAQEVSLGLLRSDYLVDQPQFLAKQVEINTVASSFGALSTLLVHAHRFVLTELGHLDMLKNLPENKALEGLCGGMLQAWEMYGKPEAAILFLVEDVTYNICDQRFHEFEIQKQNPTTRVIRRSLTQIGKTGKLGENQRLIIDEIEVGVVYFRAGYTPDHYFSELEWDARLMIERSLAIKCPSMQYHLAGTKKVQQELARPGLLEVYLSDPKKVEAVKEIFTGLYSLDKNEAGDKAIEMAMANPSNYVLKPQREGGGNNVYGEDVETYLAKIKDTEERSAWILMERINPPLQRNYMIRPNLPEPIYTDVISELGVFGVVIGDSKKILVNEQVGHMLRTKVSSANEGGVAAGLGALDSVYLVDII